jgi:NAD+ synthase
MNIEKNIEHIVDWLRLQVKNANAKGIVVGLSGGIDSSVVAFLIKKAFPNNSIGVIMPINSNPIDEKYALELCGVCKIDHIKVELSLDHKNILEKVKTGLGEKYEFDRIADSNLRARLRMSTLYTVANSMNYLVVGTDNAAEILTGYFTKYGDGGVDLVPIANLTKRQVYEFAKFFGVPDSIINRAPSAGLWEGQTDESEMGTTYDMIDDYIEGKDIPKVDKEIIEKLHLRSEHKRNMPPKPPKYLF